MTDPHAKAASELASLLGPVGWLGDAAGPYDKDWLGRGGQPLLGVARPFNTAEVAGVLAISQSCSLPIVAQGGNTSLCCGTIATTPGALVISLERMSRIVEVNEAAMTATVEAGVVLASLHERLAESSLRFPLHLGAEGSARIGGLIATNAGGSHAARHGMMMDRVLGLEVVLANGDVWSGLRETLKDNAGYALRRLFCGSEGTLGIVTQAVLRLSPATCRRATALLAVDSLDDAVTLGRAIQVSCAELVEALEFFTETGLALALEHVESLTWPLDERGGAYVLVELGTSIDEIELDTTLENQLADAFESGLIIDGTVAQSEDQREAFWRLREELPEGQRRHGLQLKHDIAVPISSIARLVSTASTELGSLCAGVRVNAFGHLADGNIHLNLSPPVDASDFGGMQEALSNCVYQLAHDAGGSIAAEHGLGRSKVAVADALRDPVERALMSSLKGALDPAGLLNPGVIVAQTRISSEPVPRG